MPPTNRCVVNPGRCEVSFCASMAICDASSRVGERMRVPTVSVAKRVSGERRWWGARPRSEEEREEGVEERAERWCRRASMAGTRKPMVLPVPVRAFTRRSREVLAGDGDSEESDGSVRGK